MRTISSKLYNRLHAQKEEATVLKKAELAKGLYEQILKYSSDGGNLPVRQDTREYVYTHEQLKENVKTEIWDAIIRVADYHNNFNLSTVNTDAFEAYIDSLADSLISTASEHFSTNAVGIYEPLVPGEEREVTDIEIDE